VKQRRRMTRVRRGRSEKKRKREEEERRRGGNGKVRRSRRISRWEHGTVEVGV
jgi:hypothetical protein